MGKILLGIMIVLEIVFLVWNLKAKAFHKTEKRVVFSCVAVCFVLLALAGVIQWGFRYYFYALFLLVQVILTVIWIVRNRRIKAEGATQSNGRQVGVCRCIVKSVFACLGYVFLLFPALLFPQFKDIPTTGNYTVESTLETYVDESRAETYDDTVEHREVNVRVWYPKEAKEGCPLVIFSHGSKGISLSNVSLCRELASNGYVVCSLDHPYQSFYTKNTSGKMTLISQEYQEENVKANTTTEVAVVYPYMKQWMQIREGDINFVLDTILQKKMETAGAEWYHKINAEKIAVCGHSLGGSAALGIGRHRDDISAVIALESPYMSDIIGVDESKNEFLWEEETYPVPVLQVYSDCTWGQFSKSQVYDENARTLQETEAKVRNVHIEGIGHLELTDLSLVSPPLTHLLDESAKAKDTHAALEKINEESLAFLDYYLKDKGTEPDMQ